MKKYLILITLGLSFILFGCKKIDDLEPTNPNETEAIGDTKFPGDFQWKTYDQVTFTLSGYAKSLVEITSDDGVVYHRLNLIPNNSLSGKFAVPAYEESVHIKYMGQDIVKDISGGSISHQFNF